MSDKDIELVIKIPEGAYNLLKTSGVDWLGAEHILNAVANGTPLPKDEDRKDVLDKIRAEIEKWHKEGTNWSDIRLMKIEDILNNYKVESER